MRLVLMLLSSGCLFSSARAGVLGPEWSRPLDATVIAASVGAKTYSTQNLFLLLADGRVLEVSASDSLRSIGRAPRGVTALVAMPTPARGASDIALLLTVSARSGACDLVAWNRNGQQLWTAPVRGIAGIDSLFFVGEDGDRAEFCAWQRGEPWLVVVSKRLWAYSAGAMRLNPGFAPRDAFASDFDGDDAPELVFFDGAQLAVYHIREGRELRCRWPEPDPARRPGSAGRTPRPRVALAAFDSVPVLLVVTGDTLRYVDALTGIERRRLAPDPASDLPGPPDAVTARGPFAYAAGTDQQGGCYVARLVLKGPARPVLSLPCQEHARVYSLLLLSDWPTSVVSTGCGPDRLFVGAPGLSGTADNSPGYSGIQFVRVVPLRIDDDTLPDLAVLRTAADARWRFDLFSNRVGQLEHELEQARQSLQRVALGRNEKDVRRTIRRVRALAREAGADQSVPGQERSALEQFRMSARRYRVLNYAKVFAAIILAGGLGVLVSFAVLRVAPPGQQIENQPLATRVALAADLVAADHNFISKGNTPAAVERLGEIRSRYGLEHDRDLARSGRAAGRELRSAYSGAISRLIDASPTLRLFDFIESAARSSPRGQELETSEMSLDSYLRRERAPGLRLVTITNHECPDYHHRFRIFVNSEARGTLEHLILDHIRHAGTWADIVLSYTVSTQWNRRLLITFRSDSPHSVPLTQTRAHITSRLRELAALLRPAIDVPRDAGSLTGPYEKLWLSVADYIAVLEETRSRLLAP